MWTLLEETNNEKCGPPADSGELPLIYRPGGQGGGGGGGIPVTIKQPQDPCPGVRAANPAADSFVRAHYNDANAVANLLQTTAANILGLSIVESNKGGSNLARNYNNYFGLTYPFPGTGPAYNSPNGNRYSTFAPGFINSAMSFARGRYAGQKVIGLTTPEDFAGALTTGTPRFNSEVPNRAPRYINSIKIAQNLIDCLSRP